MKTGYLKADFIIGEFIKGYNLSKEEIDDKFLRTVAADGTNMLGTTEQTIHKIDILDVENYKTSLPKDFSKVCEISYRYKKPENCGTKRQQITKFVQSTTEGCDLEISIKCPKCHKSTCKGCGEEAVIVDVDRVWEMANSHYYYPTRFMSPQGVQTFGRGEYPSIYSELFRLMTPASSKWFQIEKHIPYCVNTHCKKSRETYLIEYPNIEVSFKEGEILFAYLAKPTDEDGNPLIPDHPEAIEAVKKHLAAEYYQQKWLKDINNRGLLVATSTFKSERDTAIGRARSALQIPDTKSWTEWLRQNKMMKMDSALSNLYETGYGKAKNFGPLDRTLN